MTTLSECIEEAKVCLTICQPSSLVSRMTTLTVAPQNHLPVCQCSPSPMQRNQSNTKKQDRQVPETKNTNTEKIYISRI